MEDKNTELERIRSFYDTTYYARAKAGEVVSGHWLRLARRLQVQPGQAVLDVACGTGGWLRAAAGLGARPSGIDLSARAIDVCRADMPGGDFHVGPAERLPFSDGRFELVTCLGSIEHFVDPVGAIREMVRVAKPAARFVFVVPNAGFLTRRLGWYGGTHQTAAKEEVRTLAEWDALFQDGGLTVLDRWKDLHVLSWHWIGLMGLLRAPLRAAQALALALWPLEWQYQVYFECRRSVTP